jgi:hypothetical protein
MADCFQLPPEKRDGVPNISGWIPMAHSHSELVGAVREKIRSIEPDAKLSFRLRGLQLFSRQSEVPLPPDEIFLLEEYYDVFNEIFFFTALQHNRSRFKMIKAGTDEWKKQEKSKLAYTICNGRYVLSRHKVQAHIYILERVESEPHAQRMKKYVESLLHEMVHALIDIYTCSCADCGNNYKSDEGETGHGRTWQAIAHAVEKFCFNELSLELDLGRARGLANEINDAYAAMLDTYELDYVLVYEHVGELRGCIESEGDEDLDSGLDGNND